MAKTQYQTGKRRLPGSLICDEHGRPVPMQGYHQESKTFQAAQVDDCGVLSVNVIKAPEKQIEDGTEIKKKWLGKDPNVAEEPACPAPAGFRWTIVGMFKAIYRVLCQILAALGATPVVTVVDTKWVKDENGNQFCVKYLSDGNEEWYAGGIGAPLDPVPAGPFVEPEEDYSTTLAAISTNTKNTSECIGAPGGKTVKELLADIDQNHDDTQSYLGDGTQPVPEADANTGLIDLSGTFTQTGLLKALVSKMCQAVKCLVDNVTPAVVCNSTTGELEFVKLDKDGNLQTEQLGYQASAQFEKPTLVRKLVTANGTFDETLPVASYWDVFSVSVPKCKSDGSTQPVAKANVTVAGVTEALAPGDFRDFCGDPSGTAIQASGLDVIISATYKTCGITAVPKTEKA